MYKYFPHIVTFFLALFGAFAQVFFKKAMPLKFNIIDLFTNYWLIFGFILYGVAFIGYLLVLRYAPVSELYPVLAFSYIFVMILASFMLSEPVTIKKFVGAGVIIFGIFLIGG